MATVQVSKKRLFTVEEYHRMGESGILREDDRVELLEGEIVAMSPIGVRHANVVRRLNQLFTTKLGGRAIVDVQNPVRLNARSEPQPDVMLLKPKPDFYSSAHPGAEDVLLLIEVADTSGDIDREIKLPLYARHNIQEVWLVDIIAETVEAHRSPSNGTYAEKVVFTRAQSLAPQSFDDLKLAVVDILG